MQLMFFYQQDIKKSESFQRYTSHPRHNFVRQIRQDLMYGRHAPVYTQYILYTISTYRTAHDAKLEHMTLLRNLCSTRQQPESLWPEIDPYSTFTE